MFNQSLKEEIDSVDCSNFNGPSMYKADVVSPALYSLVALEDSNQAEEVGKKLIYAIGNDHAGVYFSAVLKALEIVIAIAKNTESKACKTCALGVLNDLYYFEPEVEGYEGCTAEELKKYVLSKLKSYSDELIKY